MKSCVLASVLFLICLTSYAQRCAQLSIESIGGNKTEVVSNRVVSHSDGTFSLYISGSSTSGNINTTCQTTFPSGSIGNVFYRRYNAAGTTVLNDYCDPIGSSFFQQYFYPQANGDTIFFGNKELPGRAHEISIERRSASGTVLWTKYYGGTGDDGLGEISIAPDSGFFISSGTTSSDGDVGLHYGSGFDGDIWVLRIDNNGDKLWGKVLGGSGPDLPRDIKTAPDGGCYVFGVTASSDHDATGMKGESDLYIVKLDSLGQKEWHRCLGGTATDGTGYDPGLKTLEDGQGGFYVINRTNSHDGDIQKRLPIDDGSDFWLLHIDSMANILWESTFGGPGSQVPSVFCRATDGTFWMGGQNLSSLTGGMIEVTYGMTDSWVVHADSQGNFINQRSFGNNKEDQIDVIHPLSDGTVLAGGRYNSTIMPGLTSPGFPQSTEGDYDIFFTRLGPETVNIQNNILEPTAWELFPNPASKIVRIQIKNSDIDKYSVFIADASGSIKYKSTFRNKQELNISGWQAGVYTVTLTDNSGNTGTKKLVVSVQ